MSTTEALSLLEAKVEDRINDVSKKRGRDKTWATLLKVGSVSLAGIVTVLVGLQGEQFDQNLLRNLALVVGALITVVSAFDAFFDFRALWINRTITLVRLYSLQLDLRFETAKAEPEELATEALTSLRKRLDEIARSDLREWMKLRSETGGDELQEIALKQKESGETSGRE